MGEQLDYIIDDFLSGGQAHKDHNKDQALNVAGRRSAVRGRGATGNRSSGTRGASYGVVQDTSMGQKQMNEYASYLDTKRRHDALVRGGSVANDVITFRNQETLNAYNNNRGIMTDYETKQYACDRGVANSCSSVGRSVGDGRNPLQSGNEGMLFGWTGGTGRTAPLEAQVTRRRPLGLEDDEEVIFERPTTSGVDDVPAGGGLIQPRGRGRERSEDGGATISRSQARREGEAIRPVRPQAAEPQSMPVVRPQPSMPNEPSGEDASPPAGVIEPQVAPIGGVFIPKKQRPRINNDGGGTKDGRDGMASIGGIEQQVEHLSNGFVNAPLISEEKDMTSTVMKFEFARPNKYDIGCRYATSEFLSQAF